MVFLLAQAEGSNQGMFEVLVQAAVQVPALAVLCVIVYVFLTHLKAISDSQAIRDAQYEARQKARDEHLETLGDSCHNFQKTFALDSKEFHKELSAANRECLNECKAVIKDNTIALASLRNEINKKHNPPHNMGS